MLYNKTNIYAPKFQVKRILYKFKLAEGDHKRQIALDRIHSANISSAVLPIHLAENRYVLWTSKPNSKVNFCYWAFWMWTEGDVINSVYSYLFISYFFLFFNFFLSHETYIHSLNMYIWIKWMCLYLLKLYFQLSDFK